MLILASNSPRRSQLLALAGWQFQVKPAQIAEIPYAGENPRDYVLRMAESKARLGASEVSPENLVVGCDTIVVDYLPYGPGGVHRAEILGKPANHQDAARMLRQLGGRTHQVITAVAVFRPSEERMISDPCITEVTMRNYTEEEIHAYVDTGDPLDKAGAYAIQHAGFNPVERIRGCFANVVGLPVCTLERILAQFGMIPQLALPQGSNYAICPFCQKVIGKGLEIP